MTEPPFEIKTFGGVAITRGETTTPVGGLLPQRLLGILAQVPNTPIPDHRLMDVVWPDDDPPPTSRRTLHSMVSRLRRRMGPERIHRQLDGYALTLDPTSIDSVRFERLIAAARTAPDIATVLGRVDQALGMWVGAPFGPLASERAFTARVARLTQLRNEALALRVQALTELKRLPEAALSAAALLESEPTNERAHLLAMFVADQSGDPPEALRIGHRFRQHLIETTGLSPTQRLAAAEQTLAEGQPLSWPTPLGRPVERRHISSLREKTSAFERSTLVGRSDSIREVQALLDAERLVTLTGTGGVGKTSLARASIRRAGDSREVWWCELAGTHPGRVSETLNLALGLQTKTPEPADLATALAHWDDTLVVLDNAEHVADEVRAIVEALINITNLSLLVTSRRVLGSYSEVVHHVAPLSWDSDAIELFQLRSPRTFESPSEQQAVKAICQRLDGLPLAIEIAAARTRALTPSELLQRLDRLMPHATGPANDPRHATIDTALQWSIDLLTSDQQRALGELAVFVGGFDLDAAETLLAKHISSEPVLALETLIEQSLVTATATTTGTRFGLLEPIRQYAQRHLWPDQAVSRHHHLEYYCDRLERAYETFGESSCDPILKLVQNDLGNLNAVHTWALQSGRIADDVRLFTPLAWLTWHDIIAPYQWAEETMAHPGIGEVPGWHIVAILAATYVGVMLGDQEKASAYVTPVLGLPPDDPARPTIDYFLAWACFMESRFDESLEYFDKVDTSDPQVRFVKAQVGATIHAILDPGSDTPGFRLTTQLLDEALTWTRAIGARNFEAAIIEQQAQMQFFVGNVDNCLVLAKKAETMARAVGMGFIEAQAILHQVRAASIGFDIGRPPVELLVTILESAIQSGSGMRLLFGLQPAARFLLDGGDIYGAALAVGSHEARFNDFKIHELLARLPPAVIADGERDAERIGRFSVGREVIRRLQLLPYVCHTDHISVPFGDA